MIEPLVVWANDHTFVIVLVFSCRAGFDAFLQARSFLVNELVCRAGGRTGTQSIVHHFFAAFIALFSAYLHARIVLLGDALSSRAF